MLSAADILLLSPPWTALAPGVGPRNPLLVDVAQIYQPWLIWSAGEIAAGRFPLWNPYAFAGAPFFANAQSALLFPPNALALVLPPATAVTLIAILKVLLAGLAMYWFLRVLALTRSAAFVGALVFMWSGGLTVWLQWPPANVVFTLPLLLGATERVRTHPGARPVVILALVVALAVAGGYPQTVVHGLVVAAAWALTRLRGAAGGARSLVRFAGAVALGAGLGAVQALPFLEYLRESSALFYRSQWMPAQAVAWKAAIALLMPLYYGSPTGGDFWGDANFNEMTASVGLVPWVVLPVALVAAWPRRETKFFAALAAIAALTFYDLVPVMSTLPVLSLIVITRVVAFLSLALAALCALGLDALGTADRRASFGVKAGVIALAALALAAVASDAALLTIVGLRVPIAVQYAVFLAMLTAATLTVMRALGRGPLTSGALAILATVQLAVTVPLAVIANPAIERRLFYPKPPPPALVHVQRRATEDPGRVVMADTRNIGMLYGLREAAGYDGLTPRRVERIASPFADLGLTGSGALTVTAQPSSAVFDLLSLRRVVTATGAAPPAAHFVLEYDGPDGRVYRNERALPRAFLVTRARPCVGEAAALHLMHAGGVHFQDEVLIADCDAPAAGPPGTAGRATIVTDHADRVVVETATDVPAYLVLTDTWFPGWRVSVDGVQHRLWRANHAFRAVWLPPGRHRVEFAYRPASVRFGLALTVVAAGLCAVLWLGAGRSLQRLGGKWFARLGPRAAVSVLVGLAIAGTPRAAEARLPAAPFELELSTTRVGEAGALMLAGHAGEAATDAVDVYVARFPTRAPASRFLGPDGSWAAVAQPYRVAVVPGRLAPASVTWRESGPAGFTALVVVFVRAGADPRQRENWRYRPITAKFNVLPPPADTATLARVLAPLAFLTLAACAVVTLSRWTRPSTSS